MPFEPQFFDIFGALAFIYITGFSLFLLSKKVPPQWAILILLLVGVIGLAVDALVVYTFYLK